MSIVQIRMQSKKLAKSKPGPATQRYLDIAEVRDDMVILKDGTVRAVLLVSSINFALKSADEQEAIVQSYMAFLNALDFPLQIVVQSRPMNIESYLTSLAAYQRESENELLRTQIADYRNFVQELVDLGDIMQKQFYLVIPYNPLTNKRKNFFQRFAEALSPSSTAKLNQKQIKDRIEQLDQRVGTIQSGLQSMGLNSARLDTQSLIELYYNVYNPEVFDREKLTDISKIQVEKNV